MTTGTTRERLERRADVLESRFLRDIDALARKRSVTITRSVARNARRFGPSILAALVGLILVILFRRRFRPVA
jgi:hypothetical protein